MYNLINKYIFFYLLEEPFYKTSAYHEGVTFLDNGGKYFVWKDDGGQGERQQLNKYTWLSQNQHQ